MQQLFRNWKFAALWAVGISASIGTFFTEGGGHEELELSAKQIRERRGSSDAQTTARPVYQPLPAQPTVAPADAVPDTEDPAFGEPSLDQDGSGESEMIEAPVAPPNPPSEPSEAVQQSS